MVDGYSSKVPLLPQAIGIMKKSDLKHLIGHPIEVGLRKGC